MKPSDWINEFTIKKTNWEDIDYEIKKTYNQFIINLFLSMVPNNIEIISQIQQRQVSDKYHYNFWKSILPKKKLWYKWVKGSKKKYSNQIIKLVADYYKVGTKDIKDSLDLINDEFIIDILSKNGYQEKQIKQLMK